ncbi:MAG: hypothetical protein JST27_12810 [Bacteroidetes bacterium]|nr:hypothetical protein [Bacteroidota bacterium]
MNSIFQRRLILGLLCMLLASSVFAQEVYNSSGRKAGTNRRETKQKGFDAQRLIIGGGFNLGLADGAFAVGASPIVGYRITENLSAGIGLGFQYYSFKDYYMLNVNGNNEYYPLHATLYYPSLWSRYLVYRDFFVQGEAEMDFQKITEYSPDVNGYPEKKKSNYNSPALLLGAGLRQPISDRASLVVMALYDVIQDPYSPYKGRIDFRFGFNVGF